MRRSWRRGKGGHNANASPPPRLLSLLCPPEEAVNEVKRQAMSELQKAVSDAERKAHEMISAERSKMERALAEAKRQASEDALTIINQQEDSSEVSTYHRPLPPPTFHPALFSSFAALSRVIYYPSLCFLYPRSYLVEAAGRSWLGTGRRCHDYCTSGPVVRVHKKPGGSTDGARLRPL